MLMNTDYIVVGLFFGIKTFSLIILIAYSCAKVLHIIDL